MRFIDSSMQTQLKKSTRQGAFTIAELVVCFAIVALTIGGVITAYVNASNFSARAGFALAAQAQAVQVLERVRAAEWDTQSIPPLDQTTNLPTTNIALMELPITGTNVTYATNVLSVSSIAVSANPPVSIKMITVNTTWPWNGKVFSNTVVSYRAPDQ
jgi:type II secretory pathway pseudopilin PulG